jgi:hypothetical protein
LLCERLHQQADAMQTLAEQQFTATSKALLAGAGVTVPAHITTFRLDIEQGCLMYEVEELPLAGSGLS